MMLQALTRYYERRAGAIAPPGWESKEIPFLIVLDREGTPHGVIDNREGTGKKKRTKIFLVPQAVKRSSGKAANLLWDKPDYSLASISDEKALLFVKRIEDLKLSGNPSIMAVLNFLRREDKTELLKKFPAWRDIDETGPFLSFMMADQVEPVFREPDIVKRISEMHSIQEPEARKGICLVTGSQDIIERLHPPIKGVLDAQSTGANIISFNEDAYCSYGKGQGDNAPVGKTAAFAYTTALNALLGKDSRQKIQAGDATTVFWSEKPNSLEEDFALILDPPPDDPDRGSDRVRALLNSPKSGAWLEDDDQNRFYVLGLAPNAGRIAIRFWITDTIAGMADHIRQHFEDTRIIHAPGLPESLSLSSLLRQTAALGKTKNIPPNLSGDVMRSILTGSRYPQTLLGNLIQRIRADRELLYGRAALIKAWINRKTRKDSNNLEKEELKVSLDKDNINPGYRLGRLFAALEKTQTDAYDKLNRTILDRYYAAASSRPASVFGTLLRLKIHHLAKIDNPGWRISREKVFSEILDGISDFPQILSLEDQGRFAIGYYHQMQDFYTSKKDAEKGS
ncbi:MAG: type I-C CRISPR-associated protein Cas8c/Csd1 [Planctomycetes bacterium]|nr:type I-C CRISPR-associated protein Cas8c/Csd1 [Planctomycetota bacterium]